MSPNDVDAEINRRLEAVGLAYPLTTAAVLREQAVDYLRQHDDTVGRSPGLEGQPHWNAWWTNHNSDREAFVVMVFRPDGIEVTCGSGSSPELIHFMSNIAPNDPLLVSAACRDHFDVPEEPLWLDRRTAEAWLGRPRPH